ncbi:hypothetical protein FOXYSP1_13969 [Fusarium oxysporum f. sp. phaseoli]
MRVPTCSERESDAGLRRLRIRRVPSTPTPPRPGEEMDVGKDSGSHTEAKLRPNCDSSRGLLIMTIRPMGGPQKPVKSQRGHAAQKTATAQRTLAFLGGVSRAETHGTTQQHRHRPG